MNRYDVWGIAAFFGGLSLVVTSVGWGWGCGSSAKERAEARAAEELARQGLDELCRLVEIERQFAQRDRARDGGAD